MTSRIFLIWQSEVNSNETLDKTKSTKNLRNMVREFCDKSGGKWIYDESTEKISGSPNINEIIIDKIKRADVVIADITPVFYKTKNNPPQIDRLYPNSNVLIELGCALGSHSTEQVIIILGHNKEIEENFGKIKIENLPFDINHNRVTDLEAFKLHGSEFIEMAILAQAKQFWIDFKKIFPDDVWSNVKNHLIIIKNEKRNNIEAGFNLGLSNSNLQILKKYHKCFEILQSYGDIVTVNSNSCSGSYPDLGPIIGENGKHTFYSIKILNYAIRNFDN